MAKREFIEIDNALKSVDDRVEELRKDKQFRYSKQIDVNGVKNHFFDYPIIPEQDIVKPYLKKLKADINSMDLNRIAKDYEDKFYGFQSEVLQMIDNLLSEQGEADKESKS